MDATLEPMSMNEGQPPTLEEELEDLNVERQGVLFNYQRKVDEAQKHCSQRLADVDWRRELLIKAYALNEPLDLPEPIEPFEIVEPYGRLARGIIIALGLTFCAGCSCLSIWLAYYYLILRG